MAITNISKPSSPLITNTSKPSTGSMANASKAQGIGLWSASSFPWQKTAPWLTFASDITNTSKPS